MRDLKLSYCLCWLSAGTGLQKGHPGVIVAQVSEETTQNVSLGSNAYSSNVSGVL